MYSRILSELKQRGAIPLRGFEPGATGDLDVYVPASAFSEIEDFLLRAGYTCTLAQPASVHFKKVTHEFCYHVDCTLDVSGFLKYVDNRLSDEYVASYLSAPESYSVSIRCLRYLFLFRGSWKYSRFFEVNKEVIIRNDFFLHHLHQYPFRSKLKWKELHRFLIMDPTVLIRKFGFDRAVRVLYRRNLSRFRKIGSGRIVLLIGPDGSGKSSLTQALKQNGDVRSTYMGFGSYPLKSVLNSTRTSGYMLPFTRPLSKFVAYAGNWMKYGRAVMWKLTGKKVVIDRHPFYDHIFASKRDRKWYFDLLLYRFLFPRYGVPVLLETSVSSIAHRKPERSEQEITAYYLAATSWFAKRRCGYRVRNECFDEALQELMNIAYEE